LPVLVRTPVEVKAGVLAEEIGRAINPGIIASRRKFDPLDAFIAQDLNIYVKFLRRNRTPILVRLLNSKSETLNPKQYRNSNVQNSEYPKAELLLAKTFLFRALGFRSLEFVSDFDIRISYFFLTLSLVGLRRSFASL
jgi:hypothetical protein